MSSRCPAANMWKIWYKKESVAEHMLSDHGS